MSESNDLPPITSGAATPREPEEKPGAQPKPQDAKGNEDPTEALKRNLEQTRLPPDLKEEILAALAPPEERERMCRELIQNGGLSFEEFFEAEGKPRTHAQEWVEWEGSEKGSATDVHH